MMRAAVVVGLCVLGSGAFAAPASSRLQFEAFKKEHKKEYESTQEEAKRYRIFVSNLHQMHEQARRNPLATFGVNRFADRSQAERRAMRAPTRKALAGAKAASRGRQLPTKSSSAPDPSIDWQRMGAVTAVPNQGDCAADYAFSALGTIEAQWYLAGNPLTPLSGEEIVDCDSKDDGCNGGTMVHVYDWILSNQSGIVAANASYPYTAGGTGKAGMCQWGLLYRGSTVGAVMSGYKALPPGDEKAMEMFGGFAGPLSVGIDATTLDFYTGGVMTNCTCSTMDSAALITGYDTTAAVPYWRIRNQ